MRMASAKRWRHWADGEGSDSAPEDLLTETPTSYELRQSNRSSNNRQKDALRAVSVARALPPLGPGYHHIAISTAAFRADQPLFPLQHRRLGVITSSHRGVGLGLQLRRWVLGRAPCQSFSTWERSRKRGTLWLIDDPPASLCPRSGNMPTRSSLFFSWSTMVPVIDTTWPQAFEGKRTRSPGLRVACSLLLISAYP